MKKEDLNFLMDICSVQSSSTIDTDIMNYIKNYIVKILSLNYTEDDFGNIYVTKGEGKNGYKCLVSHTDTVHSLYEYRKVFFDKDHIFAMGYNGDEVISQVGIGGDDRVGNYMCLKGLKDFNDIKVVFFRFEETGCKGSKACNMDFFKDCNFVIEPDRKGYGDFIRSSCGTQMCSDDFIKTMEPIFTDFGYKIVEGISTDVDKLKSRGLEVCCINLGCGYFNPHSTREVLHVPSVQACYNLIITMFEKHGKTRFEHKYVPHISYSSYKERRNGVHKLFNDSSSDIFSFSNKKEKNFFSDALNKEIYLDSIPQRRSFLTKLTSKKYKNFNELVCGLFQINNAIPIYVYKTSQIVYLPLEDVFYDLKENTIVKQDLGNQLYKDLIVEDTDNIFVFSQLNGSWIRMCDAVWDKSYMSWDLKDMIKS